MTGAKDHFDLPFHAESSIALDDEFEHRGFVPHVKVDAVIFLVERLCLSCDGFSIDRPIDVLDPFLEVLLSRSRWPLDMILYQVLERSDRAISVERLGFVGQGEIQYPAGSENPQECFQSANRVFGVFEKVVRDDEILRLIVDRSKRLAVIDDVRLDELHVA